MGRRGSVFSISGSIAITLFSLLLIVIIIGIGLGLTLAETRNTINQENFVEFAPALPTKLLDINGILITEFSADEKRELVLLSDLPRHLIHAALVREDPNFYSHRGFSVKGIARAAFGKLIGKALGGGSTITQQVAGTLYTDRSEMTIKRKIKELWWAIQLERRYTKNEILEIYLNYMYMGPGTYGVEAASKYFFGHSAKEITLAEAALLVIQLSSPSRYNPLDNPNIARDRQRFVLDRMIQFGYATEEEAEASFNEYWANYDFTRASTAAFFHRDDKAPWFSEYARRELEKIMYGSMDYYRDGYTVYTTLDLRHQEAADKFMAEGLAKANKEFARSKGRSNVQAERIYIPIVDLLTLTFGLSDIHKTSSAQNEQKSISRYTRTVNPIVDMAALAFGIQDLKVITNAGFGELKDNTERNIVEGALISIENQTGYITAIVGGSKYDESNQLIRATQGNIQPGSSFKPLYYSAAIDTRKLTAASLIYDVPVVFHNEDGTPYLPQNFRGEWKGSVLLYDALSHSMNVPSLKVLDAIGFDAAINRAAELFGMNLTSDQDQIRKTFPRVYPLGLGIISASPLRMARAFAVFGNQGREVTPIAIRYVEDRNGRMVLDPEKDLRQQQRRSATQQVISPQNAYIMSKILEKTVEEGSLANGAGWGAKFTFKDENGKTFRMPVAGKTGTPQNWSDAWAVGYSPYYTTAIWFGFDKPGNSLGVELTGSTLAGPVWGDYMRAIHQGLPRRDFVHPALGVVDVTVCAKSGLLKTAACNQGEVTLPFLSGTQPAEYCDIHGANARTAYERERMRDATMGMNDAVLIGSLPMPSLPPDLFLDLPGQNQNNRTNRNTGGRTNQQPANTARGQISWPSNNTLLDDDIPISPVQESSVRTADNQEYFRGTQNASTTVNSQAKPEYQPPPPARGSASQEASGEYPLYDLEIPAYNPLLD